MECVIKKTNSVWKFSKHVLMEFCESFDGMFPMVYC